MSVQDLIPFIVSGAAVGAVYGLTATGLVLTYKTSGIFNFGHGALATAAAYLFYSLHERAGLGWPPALLLSVAGVGVLAGLLMERVAARLSQQPATMMIVGTVGLILLVQGIAAVLYGSNTIRVPSFLPGADDTLQLGGVAVTYDKVTIAAVSFVAVGALYALFRFSRLGLAMRAVVDDPDLLALQGTDPARIRRLAWIIGSLFAALSGVLVTPLIGLDSILLTFTVVQAFAAAAIGGFASLPLTLAGGVLVGVLAGVAGKYSFDIESLSGLPASVPFLMLLLVLLVRGRRLAAASTPHAPRREPYRGPAALRAGAAAVVVGVLLAVPSLAEDDLPYYTTAVATAIMLLSLGLLVRVSGQVSLCHAAFAAVGAVSFSQLTLEAGVPWTAALVLAGLVAVPVGALVAVPAIRLSGLFLALATFGFGILVQNLLYSQEWMFTHLAQGREMPHPSYAQTPERFYYVSVGLLVLVGATMVAIQRGRLGRLLRGLGGSPTSVEAMGLNVNVARVTVFCVSAFFAALAGVIVGVDREFATSAEPFFGSTNSLILLAMLALAPFAEPWYALVPAVGVVLPAYVEGGDAQHLLNAFFGLSALLVATAGGNPTMPDNLRRRLDRLRRKPRRAAAAARVAPPAERACDATPSAGLSVRGLSVTFGGLAAVDGVDLDAPCGYITGLIGPNGAGKTSTFNAVSGLNRSYGGTVQFDGRRIDALGAAARARRGLGRTFQQMQLCEGLTVEMNVALAQEARITGASPVRQLIAGPRGWRATRRATASALSRCDIGHLADRQVSELSTGQRRLVELARCLAGGYHLLLLDEPSSGLDGAETARFGALLSELVAETGMGVLLIEHDMALVARICDRVLVLDFGKVIFRGTPAEVLVSQSVRAAYLGTEPVTLEEAGR